MHTRHSAGFHAFVATSNITSSSKLHPRQQRTRCMGHLWRARTPCGRAARRSGGLVACHRAFRKRRWRVGVSWRGRSPGDCATQGPRRPGSWRQRPRAPARRPPWARSQPWPTSGRPAFRRHVRSECKLKMVWSSQLDTCGARRRDARFCAAAPQAPPRQPLHRLFWPSVCECLEVLKYSSAHGSALQQSRQAHAAPRTTLESVRKLGRRSAVTSTCIFTCMRFTTVLEH